MVGVVRVEQKRRCLGGGCSEGGTAEELSDGMCSESGTAEELFGWWVL